MEATLRAPSAVDAASPVEPWPSQTQSSAQPPQDMMMLTPEQLATLREGIRLAMERRMESGLVPYQGQWLPRAEVEARLRAERRASWVHLGQLVALSAVATAFSLLLFAVLRALL